MSVEATAVPVLRSVVPVLIAGADARTFLHGQLSADLRQLTPKCALLATCNSAHGRVQSVLTLVEHEMGIVALVPAELAQRFVARLRGYVLRARVTLAVETGLVAAALTVAQAAGLGRGLPPQVAGACAPRGPFSLVKWWGADARYLLLAPREAVEDGSDARADLHWYCADIAAGLPRIHPETHEAFVAQMLNLDLLGGIAFDKGCYRGQEIIARMQYRGTLRRRMFRYRANSATAAPGTRVLCAGKEVGTVVDACGEGGAACELLAVVDLDRANDALELDAVAGSVLTRLSLPYAVTRNEAA